MMLEGPILQGSIGRLPETDANMAAWGLTMSLALIIESPVIMLLATAIALVKDLPSYRALRQFVLVLCALCTVISAALCLTPLLDFVAGTWMQQPRNLVEASRPALQIMIFWTAAIGWRRFCQGILGQRDILRFHTPLAATTLLTLLAQPLTQAALARQPFAEITLSAWPVVYMILLILRGFGLALQEVTVAEQRRSDSESPLLSRFTWLVGGATTLAAVILALTPLLDGYLGGVLQLRPHLWSAVRIGVLTGALLPLVTALGSYARGVLVARGQTKTVYNGMVVSILMHAGMLATGVVCQWPGIATGTISLTIATLAEYLFLRRAAARVSDALPST
jgi:hypothetical protein